MGGRKMVDGLDIVFHSVVGSHDFISFLAYALFTLLP